MRTCSARLLFMPTKNWSKKRTQQIVLNAALSATEAKYSKRVMATGKYPSDTNSFRIGTCDIDFENHSKAFNGKSTWEILRALSVLKMCSVNVFVNNSLTIMNFMRRILGKRVLRALLKPMLYNQFVGGENHQEIRMCLRKLHKTGIRPMLAATMEEDINELETRKDDVYDSNCSRILECMEIATLEQTPEPMMQLKMTGLLPAELVVELSRIYSACSLADKIRLIRAIVLGLSHANLEVEPLISLEKKKIIQLEKALLRFSKIGKEAILKGVKILVDAEYTYMNSGLSLLTMAMTAVFNKESATIWNTYQCYLKDAQSKLSEELHVADELQLYFGAKLVRGAYHVQERVRAEALNVQCPVCDNYEATNHNYNKVLNFLLEKAATRQPKCTFIVASHNEESILLAIKRFEDLNIDKEKGGVSFGQLYGMCDQITYPLAVSGFAVYKSIPYGTLEEVLPYLSRRATENKAVLEGTRKEQALLWREVKRRICRRE